MLATRLLAFLRPARALRCCSSGFNLYGSACCGGLYGFTEPNPGAIVNGGMQALGFATGTGSGGPLNCASVTIVCFLTDTENGGDPITAPWQVYDSGQFVRGVWESQFTSGTNTASGYYNGSLAFSVSPPHNSASARQNWLRIGAGGDRSWLPEAFSDGFIAADVSVHTAAYNKIAGFYAGRSQTSTAGPLDLGWYMPASGINGAGGGVATSPFTVGIGMAGWAMRPLSAWYTGPEVNVTNAASVTKDFAAVGGDIDPAITAFCSGANSPCLINTLYGQAWITSGATYANVRPAGNDLIFSGAARPTVTLASLSGHPTLHFSGAQQGCTAGTPLGGVRGTYPINLAVVGRRTGNTSAQQYLFTSDAPLNLGFSASANTTLFSFGANVTPAAADGNWHSLDLMGVGSTGGTANVDGVSTAASFTTSPAFPTYYCVGGHSGNFLTGDIAEIVMTYNGTFGVTRNFTAPIFANQSAYWGAFPTGTVVDTVTFRNVGAGTTPGSAIPKHVELNLPPGAVPLGSIAVPSVSGTPINYQYDCAAEPSVTAFAGSITAGTMTGAATPLIVGSSVTGLGVTPGTIISAIVTAASNTYTVTPSQTLGSTSLTATFGGCNVWPDGSLKNAAVSMFLPTLASAATEQVVWNAATGSYSSGGLGVTPATVAAASDYRVYAQNVNTIWVNNALMPTGIAQVGCAPTAGSIPSPGGCVIRIQAGSVGTHYGFNLGNNCNTNPIAALSCITGSDNTVTVASSAGTPTIVTCSTTPCPAGAVRGALVLDTTTPGNIPNNTTIISTSIGGGGNTLTLSTHATIINGDTIAFLYPVNGCTNAGFYFTLNATTGLPTSVTVPAYGTGSACALVGSGAEKFFFNDYLSLYGANQPPSCAAAGGSAKFTGSYSSGTLTASAVTGALSKGQIVTDSVGARALVTAGSGSSWTVNAALTNGSMTARVPVCVYANGNGSATSGMYGLRLWGPLIDASSGAADPGYERVWGYVEYWVNNSALVSVRAIAGIDNSVYLPSGTSTQVQWPSETMDLDFTNGTTPGGAGEIRGAAQGAGMWTHLTTEAPTVFYSADPALSGPVGISGMADWLGPTSGTFSLATSEAWNSVQVSRAGSDISYWHGNHAHMPLDNSITVSPTVLTTATGSYYGLAENLGYYRPYDATFVDDNSSTAWNNGGDHFFLSPDGAALAYVYYAWLNGASDGGMSWLQQLRVSAMEIPGQAAGLHEDVTGHTLNLDYAWSNKPAAFTDPVELYSHVLCNNGFDPQTTMCNNINQSGQKITQTPCCGAANDASHWPVGNPPAIASIEGERWEIDLVNLEAANVEQTEYDDYRRAEAFNGRTWYGLVSDVVGENRVMGWSMAGVQSAIQFLPAAEPDAQYQAHILANWYDFRAAWYKWIGTSVIGILFPSPTTPAGATGTKSYDWSSLGIGNQPVDLIEFAPNTNLSYTLFEMGYESMSMDQGTMYLNHAVPSLDTVAGYFVDNMIVQMAAANPCAYNMVSYSSVGGVINPTGPNQTQPFSSWDMTNPATSGQGNISLADSLTLETYAGSTQVTEVAGPSGAGGAPTPDGLVETQLGANITTTSASAAGTSITVPGGTLSNVFPDAIVNDVTKGTGPFFVQAASGTTITLMSATPTNGVNIGDHLYISRRRAFPDWPPGCCDIYPSGTIVRFTAADGNEFVNSQTAPHAFPVQTSPAGGVLEGVGYVWCRSSTGAFAGTINPLGTNCASPAPITFSANQAFNATWVVNDTCPPVTQGTWNTFGDYQSPTSRLAELWASVRGRLATAGSTTARTTAQTNLTPSFTTLQATFGGGNNPRWNLDNHF